MFTILFIIKLRVVSSRYKLNKYSNSNTEDAIDHMFKMYAEVNNVIETLKTVFSPTKIEKDIKSITSF